MIEISMERYNELIRAEERIATVQRLVDKGEYVSVGDIKTILGINEATVESNDE